MDSAKGNISGTVLNPGSYRVALVAKNKLGKSERELRIEIGDKIALTPPLGWNSWNTFWCGITQEKVLTAAYQITNSGLRDHGYTYINMDDCWEDHRDAHGILLSNPKTFPNMKEMIDEIHGLGLKVGIYSSPGPYTCGRKVASLQHEDQDVATWAAWGIDYLKYDWCSYDGKFVVERAKAFDPYAPQTTLERHKLSDELMGLELDMNKWADKQSRDASWSRRKEILKALDALESFVPQKTREAILLGLYKDPYQTMRSSLNKVNRDIVYSLCQYGMGDVYNWGAEPSVDGNLWRTTPDIQANWKSISSNGFSQTKQQKGAAPGHWNDPDMLEVGNGTLTADEDYTHVTLWSVLAAPLIIGNNMAKLNPFLIALLGNDEVLAVDQDELGIQGTRILQNGTTEVWMRPLADGSLAVALFNRGDTPAEVSAPLASLKLSGSQKVRDLWRQQNLSSTSDKISATVAVHSAEFYRVTPAGK